MNRIVTREEWNVERAALLESEKEMTRQRDAMNRRRSELPWVQVEKDYRFTGARGQVSLEDLFAGRSQLIVYHFMFGPDWKEGCPSCSLWSDGFQGALPHLAERDVTLAAVSSAAHEKLEEFRERMGWQHDWYSSAGSDFNHDFHVTYTDSEIQEGATFYNFRRGEHYGNEAPGLSAFHRVPDGTIFHTYSCYGRGLEDVSLFYALVDRTPLGRREEGLEWPMAWVRIKDQYGRES